MSHETPELVTNPEMHLATVRETVSLNEIPALYDRAYPLIFASLGAAGLQPAGPPLGLSHDAPGERFDLSVAVPVASPFAGAGDVRGEHIPEGRAARMLVRGAYDSIGPMYERLYAWIEEQGLTPTGLAWEQYLTEPEPGGDPALNETMLWVQVSQSVEP